MDQEFVRIGKYLVSIRVLLAILPVGGVIIGFVLGWIKDWFQEGSQAKRYKSLLKFEIDHNLRLLEGTYAQMSQKRLLLEQNTFAGTERSPEEKNREIANALALQFTSIPWSNWRRNVWESQVGILTRVLNGTEIQKIHQFYSNLDKIFDIRLKIKAVENEIRERTNVSLISGGGSVVPGVGGLGTQHIEKKANLWREGEAIIIKILEERNPLGQ